MRYPLFCFIALIFNYSVRSEWSPGTGNQPNIVYILADDMGYNDISYQNPEIITPKMENLANQGVKFSQFYVQPTCSPSRSALLSGKYPIHTGFNTGAIGWAQNKGLEKEHTTLAESLSDLGYVNHMVGKWHIGWCKSDYLPHYRGFKTFNGIYLAGTDHYHYQSTEDVGYDLHSNDSPNFQDNGTYSSHLYAQKSVDVIANHDTSNPLFLYVALQNIHTPLEVPNEYLTQYQRMTRKRRLASAMVTSIDDAVDKIYQALDDKGILNNTIIVFSSDNGGQPKTGGASNTPLRGGKNTWWEGGLRVPSWMYSPLFKDGSTFNVNGNNTCLFHISDWYSTIYGLAGGDPSSLSVDGINQWDSIKSNGLSCQRSELLHNILNSDSAYRDGDYKLILGNPGDLNDWYDTSNKVAFTGNIGSENEFLFNVMEDPNETNNLAGNNPDIVASIKAKINALESQVKSYNNGRRCSYQDAVNSQGVWTPGCCS